MYFLTYWLIIKPLQFFWLDRGLERPRKSRKYPRYVIGEENLKRWLEV